MRLRAHRRGRQSAREKMVAYAIVSIFSGLAVVACNQPDSRPSSEAPPSQQQSGGSAVDTGRDARDTTDSGAIVLGTECPFPFAPNTPVDASCPSGCTKVLGTELDAENDCKRVVTVGCVSCAGRCGGAPDGYCVKSLSDGRVFDDVGSYVLDSLPASEWAACTTADVLTVPVCN